MSRTARGLLSVLLVLATVVSGRRAAADTPSHHPIDVVALPDGALWILDQDGSLLAFDPTGGTSRVIARFLGFEVRGAAVRGVGDELRIYVVASHGSPPGRKFNRIVSLAPSGRKVAKWTTFGLDFIGGIAADPGTPRLFLSDILQRRMYQLDLRRDGATPDGLVNVFSAIELGAVSFDAEAGRLFIADPAAGRVLAVPVAGGPAVEVGDGLGLPTDLTVDRPRGRVLALDALNGRVWEMPLTGKGAARNLADLPDWEDPTALVTTPDGHLWIADRSAGRVTELSPAGELLRVIDLDRLSAR